MHYETDEIRIQATKKLVPEKRGELGQFLTPDAIASFMASFFALESKRDIKIDLLEAGAGIGSLISAFLDKITYKTTLSITAYEIDTLLTDFLKETLEQASIYHHALGSDVSIRVLNEDYIESVFRQYVTNEKSCYNYAIINPPYKKITSGTRHSKLLKAIGVDATNMYSAFLSLVIYQLATNGEVVAIIPRSFCNGLYYQKFRYFLLEHCCIKRIHLFESRTNAFKDDNVLQENIIIHLIKGFEQGKIVVSKSTDNSLLDLTTKEFEFDKIVKQNDDNKFIYLPDNIEDDCISNSQKAKYTLEQLGVSISTGPIVDFRMKTHLREFQSELDAPLIYPVHFKSKEIEWPYISKKPNAIEINEETQKSLWPNGYYAVVRRFSSKEEKQRIVARIINPSFSNSKLIGLENHLNVFHIKKGGLDPNLAYGLGAYLCSSFIDKYFRSFNGHTQVNASDLKNLRYPSLLSLLEIGEQVKALSQFDSESVDSIIKKYI